MAQPEGQRSLAGRLRELRLRHRGGVVTQARLAAVLGVSTPSISSWESGAAVPPAERLRDYALAFAADRVFASGRALTDGRALEEVEADLSPAEERRRQDLIDELVRLRDRAMRPDDAPTPGTGALGGRFWYFPDSAPIRIISTPAWPSLGRAIPYADPWHPNYVQSFHDVDRDATIELFGHIRAENPLADVRFLTADRATRDDLTGHVIVLGQGDAAYRSGAERAPESQPTVMQYLVSRLELPVATRLPQGADPDLDQEYIVTVDESGQPRWYSRDTAPAKIEVYRPRFLRGPDRRRQLHQGLPILEYDVGLLARKPNELNLATTVTICSGVFSRGTYGAVRSLTDPTLRSRNEQFLIDQFGGLGDFWFLFYVPVFRAAAGLETVTPDLERPFHRLRSSA
ncbi:MAG TPA: helix-turn-helix transcriptional regulator [Kineosporiaceae bacterium]